nr:unnamed protein product [Digitaria exilis]
MSFRQTNRRRRPGGRMDVEGRTSPRQQRQARREHNGGGNGMATRTQWERRLPHLALAGAECGSDEGRTRSGIMRRWWGDVKLPDRRQASSVAVAMISRKRSAQSRAWVGGRVARLSDWRAAKMADGPGEQNDLSRHSAAARRDEPRAMGQLSCAVDGVARSCNGRAVPSLAVPCAHAWCLVACGSPSNARGAHALHHHAAAAACRRRWLLQSCSCRCRR